MGKHKQRERDQQESRGAAEQSRERVKSVAAEQIEQSKTPGSTSDTARKSRKRFGHN